MNRERHFADSAFVSHLDMSSLQRVVLTANCIETIPFPQDPSDFLSGIKYLALSDNHIRSWAAIDALSCWLPALEALSIGGNPLVNGENTWFALERGLIEISLKPQKQKQKINHDPC